MSCKKHEKLKVSQAIVAAIRGQDPPGRFVEKHPESGRLYDIGEKKAVEKTSQALREGAPKLRSKMTENFFMTKADNTATTAAGTTTAANTTIGNTSVTGSVQQAAFSPLTVGGHYLPLQAAAMVNPVANMEYTLLDSHLTLEPNTSMYQTVQNTNYHQSGIIPTAIDPTLPPMDHLPFLVPVPLTVEQMQPQAGFYVPTAPNFDNVAPQHTFYCPEIQPDVCIQVPEHLGTQTEISQSAAVRASVLPSEGLKEVVTDNPSPPVTSPTDENKDEVTNAHLGYDILQTSESSSIMYPSQTFPFDYVPGVRRSMFRDSNLSSLSDYSAMLQQSLISFEYEDLENLEEHDLFASDVHMATCFRSSSRFSRGSRTVPRGDSMRSVLSGLSDISDALSMMQIDDATSALEGDGMRQQSFFFEPGNHPTIRRGGFAFHELSKFRPTSKQSSTHSKDLKTEGSDSSPTDSNPNPSVRFSIPSLSNSIHVDFDEYISSCRDDQSTTRRLVGPLGLSLLQRSSLSKFSMLTDAASFLEESELEGEDETANVDPLVMWRDSDAKAL